MFSSPERVLRDPIRQDGSGLASLRRHAFVALFGGITLRPWGRRRPWGLETGSGVKARWSDELEASRQPGSSGHGVPRGHGVLTCDATPRGHGFLTCDATDRDRFCKEGLSIEARAADRCCYYTRQPCVLRLAASHASTRAPPWLDSRLMQDQVLQCVLKHGAPLHALIFFPCGALHAWTGLEPVCFCVFVWRVYQQVGLCACC